MKRRIFMLALALVILAPLALGAKKTEAPIWGSKASYSVEPQGIGKNSNVVFRVTGDNESKDVEDAVRQALKNAVSAVLFKGIPSSSANNSSGYDVPALCRDANAEQANKAYFDKFFADGGEYKKYVNRTTTQAPSGRDRLKLKKGYRVTVSVEVYHTNLRKKLEADGIIKTLGGAF